jgi:hypothetical protein
VVFLFRDKSIVNIIFLVLLGLLVHLHGFTVPIKVVANHQDGWFAFLLNNYAKTYHSIGRFFSLHDSSTIAVYQTQFLVGRTKNVSQLGLYRCNELYAAYRIIA